jgi:hypothetical protein
MAWTTPKTWASGALSASEMNTYVSDNDTELYDRLVLHGIDSSASVQTVKSARYGVALRRALYSVADTSDVAIPFVVADERWKDDNAFHSDVQQDRVIAPTDGTYDIDAYAVFASNGTGWRSLWIKVNSSTDWWQVRVPTAGSNVNTAITTSLKLELSANDYISAYVRQNSGGALNTTVELMMHRVNV